MLDTALNLVSGISFIAASLIFVLIQQRYYSQTRFNVKRLLYIGLAGASFTFGLQILGRTHAFLDPALRLIPVTAPERVMGVCLLVLALHGLSLRERLEDTTIENAGIIPEYLRFWHKPKSGD